jgi:fibronectin type 3 domain-containing protein
VSGTVKLNSDPVGETKYVDKTAQPGQTYYYVAKSVNANGESIASNEVQVTIPSP